MQLEGCPKLRKIKTSSSKHPGKAKGWHKMKHWQIQPYLLLAPVMLVIGILFGGGLILALLQSLGLLGIGAEGSLSWAAYGRVLRDPDFVRSLQVSCYLAVLGTGLSLGLGLGLALLLRSAGRWATFICQVTLPIPHLVGVAGILLLLSPSGLLSRVAYALQWTGSDQDFPLLVNDVGYVGVLIHMLWKEVPFAALILLAVLRGMGSDYEMQSRLLGSNRWQSFWYVTLPLLRPGLLSAGVLIFGFVFGSFEVPLLLGPTYPRALPVQVYQLFSHPDLARRQEAMALGILMAVISISLVGILLGTGWQRQSAQKSGQVRDL